jgi:two-component system, LytTR family, sensor kinase
MSELYEKLKNGALAFWILQTIGWSGYALDRYLSSQRFFPRIFIYLLVACALTFVLRAVYRRIWRGSPSILTVGFIAVGCSILAGFMWLLISQMIFWIFSIDKFEVPSWPGFLQETALYTLQHHKPFLFLSWSALYFGIKYWQDLQNREEQKLRAETSAREAELKMLRYQLNPHFLFNSLNSTSALIREDPERAERMLNELSEFLRYSLTHSKVADAPLKDELNALRNYLDVEKIRFEEKLDVRFAIAPSAENFRVPSFLIHPLVENAIKHGMQTSPLPLKLEITAKGDDAELVIEVVNTGKLKDGKSNGTSSAFTNGTGTGLKNVRERLQQTFDKRGCFQLFERAGRVHARIEIKN